MKLLEKFREENTKDDKSWRKLFFSNAPLQQKIVEVLTNLENSEASIDWILSLFELDELIGWLSIEKNQVFRRFLAENRPENASIWKKILFVSLESENSDDFCEFWSEKVAQNSSLSMEIFENFDEILEKFGREENSSKFVETFLEEFFSANSSIDLFSMTKRIATSVSNRNFAQIFCRIFSTKFFNEENLSRRFFEFFQLEKLSDKEIIRDLLASALRVVKLSTEEIFTDAFLRPKRDSIIFFIIFEPNFPKQSFQQSEYFKSQSKYFNWVRRTFLLTRSFSRAALKTTRTR